MADQLVDSHCHLDFGRFDQDRDAVVSAAREAGLVAIINPGTNLETSQRAIELAEKYTMVYAAVGIHPHEASSFDSRTRESLQQLADHPKVVAIGEIGLDYYRNYSPAEAQKEAFEAQLELATELNLPVIIHNREASDATMATLRDWAASHQNARGVLHSYSGGLDYLDQVLDLGLYIGISGPVTFPKAHGLHRVAQAVPLDRVMVETDAPFLTPIPYRGRRNQPAYVKHVADKVADLRGLEPDQLALQTTKNVIELFDPK